MIFQWICYIVFVGVYCVKIPGGFSFGRMPSCFGQLSYMTKGAKETLASKISLMLCRWKKTCDKHSLDDSFHQKSIFWTSPKNRKKTTEKAAFTKNYWGIGTLPNGTAFSCPSRAIFFITRVFFWGVRFSERSRFLGDFTKSSSPWRNTYLKLAGGQFNGG